MSFFADAATSPFIKFDDTNIQKPVEMTIVAPYKVRDSVYMGEVRRDKKGRAIQESVIPVEVEGEPMTLAVSKWRQRQAIGLAVQAAGAPDLEIGGKLTVTYVGKEKVPGAPAPAQMFKASYVRGDGGPATPAPQSAPTPAPQRDPYADLPADPWGNLG